MEEYVYILSNESMPGLIKIGRTSREIDERVKELNSATGVPTPFVIEKVFCTQNSHTLEYLIHNDLALYRVANNREFFQLTPAEAIEHIQANHLNDDQSEKVVLLFLKQGKWEYENLPSNEWSEKGRHYKENMALHKEQEKLGAEKLRKLCRSVIFEVEKYPRDLWSPETIELIDNINAGRISEKEQTYLDILEFQKALKTKEAEKIKERKKAYAVFGYQYIEDEKGNEISVFSIKHPNFHNAVQDRDFIRRLKEL